MYSVDEIQRRLAIRARKVRACCTRRYGTFEKPHSSEQAAAPGKTPSIANSAACVLEYAVPFLLQGSTAGGVAPV